MVERLNNGTRIYNFFENIRCLGHPRVLIENWLRQCALPFTPHTPPQRHTQQSWRCAGSKALRCELRKESEKTTKKKRKLFIFFHFFLVESVFFLLSCFLFLNSLHTSLGPVTTCSNGPHHHHEFRACSVAQQQLRWEYIKENKKVRNKKTRTRPRKRSGRQEKRKRKRARDQESDQKKGKLSIFLTCFLL